MHYDFKGEEEGLSSRNETKRKNVLILKNAGVRERMSWAGKKSSYM